MQRERAVIEHELDFLKLSRSALSALTHWLAYKTEIYRDHPITEGAVVTELCGLLRGVLPRERRLIAEHPADGLKTTPGNKVRCTPSTAQGSG